jgi:ESS family glutamate:Na+ symporter
MDFWDYEIWELILQIGFLLVLLLAANIMRRKIPFLKKSLLPSAVIAGILALIIKSTGLFDAGFVDNSVMEAITYHTLGFGFIAIALKTNKGKLSKERNIDIFNSGLLVVGTYLLQAVAGLAITLVLSYTVMPGLFKASGLLLPLGYGQGSGQALNFGKIYDGLGFEGGATFGLSLAAAGFLFACIGGVIYLNILVRKGKLKRPGDTQGHFIMSEEIETPNEIPLAESVDKFTIQVALVVLVYVITYLFMFGITELINRGFLGNFGTNTLRPLVWGFNFLLGTIFAVIAKQVMKKLQKHNIMTRIYANNFMLNRIGGFMFDVMIIAGICAIDIRQLNELWIPFAILCVAGGILTFYYVAYTCKKIFPKYPLEATLSMYGMLTGTASTGMVLLREADPNFDTPAANNLVMQSIYAIIFGFPMLLLLGYAPQGDTESIITLAAVFLLFIVMNILLFRKFIFRKKAAIYDK